VLIKALGAERVLLLAPRGAPGEFEGCTVIREGFTANGYLWDQVVLPSMFRKAHAEILWSPANLGPVTIENQVVTIHDGSIWAMPQGFSPLFVWWYRLVLPVLAKRARAILTVSEFSKRQLVRYLRVPEEKIVVSGCGVSERFKPQNDVVIDKFRKEKKLPPKFILALGSRAPNKNLRAVLRAWRIVNDDPTINEWWLVLAGGLTSNLKADRVANELSGLHRVVDVGYVHDKDLPLLYAAAGLFVFPSLYEGFGLPPLEAMACGTPVAVSKAAALPEVVGNAGVFFDPNDPHDIAKTVTALIHDDKKRAQLAQKGLERAANFSWEITATNILRSFEEVRTCL